MIKLITNLLNSNNKKLQNYKKTTTKINNLKNQVEKLNDDELKNKFNDIKLKINNSENKELELNKNIEEIFAIIRESSKRVLNMEHYDVQLTGGLCLHNGEIAEMKTGEGKTLVATLPAITNALIGKVHVVTVNDYLAERDLNIMKPLYDFLDISNGFINSTIDPFDRNELYTKDILYITNNELAFDFLRDNMVHTYEMKMQKEHRFVLIDEVDSVLIDEARNPLIISGEANLNIEVYLEANEVAKKLKVGKEILNKLGEIESTEGDFILKEKEHTIVLTEDGIEKIEEAYGLDNAYEVETVKHIHYVTQALIAQHIKHLDVDYIIKENQIKIIDQSTGRISDGVRYSDGLHQAIEAKEKVQIKPESKTIASTTYQNFFRRYKKISGMTGTAQTEATEFWEIYKLNVISIPTNIPVQRKDLSDLIFLHEDAKFKAIAKKVKELKEKGQPVLLGTASIEKSELLSKYLEQENIEHTILNAKNHYKEAEIIENAGQIGSITVATNMAGRGVDIKLGKGVLELGGLYVIGTERHESRRIDNQLRGRSGRQGDIGTTQFYLSLEDKLIKVFGGETLPKLMTKIGLKEDDVIESSLVSKSIENAQKKFENYNFETRKNLIEYDNVINDQRKVIYGLRDEILEFDDKINEKIITYKDFVVNRMVNTMDQKELLDSFNERFDIEIHASVIEKLENKDIVTKLSDILNKAFELRLSKLTEEQRISIMKSIFIETLDRIWLDHLNNLDVLKSGIGLRSYNQKDPLIEFKKDSYNMFLHIVDDLKIDFVKIIYKIVAR